jgi:hypothetical protein
MWLHIQTWLPLVTVSLTAAICFSVGSFIMGSAKIPMRVKAHRSKD